MSKSDPSNRVSSVLSATRSASVARWIFFVLLAGAFFYVVYPLILPVLMGGVLAVLFIPLAARMERRGIKAPLASFLITFGITLIVLIPTAVLVYQGAKSGVQEFQHWKDSPQRPVGDWTSALLESPTVHSLMLKVTAWFPIGIQDLTETLQDTVRSVGIRAAELLGALLASLPKMAFDLIIVVVSLYFFLVDAHRLGNWVRRKSIFPSVQTERLLQVLAGVCRSVVLAAVISGLAQAVFYGFFMLVTGAPNAILVISLIFFASFIPVIGAVPATFGMALGQLLSGHTVSGAVLLAAAVLTAMLDNLVRPWFLKGTANLHPLLAFIAAFGGLQVLGFVGVFLGPIIASLFLVLVDVVSD
ncbi:MAG: AI-2E family transporter [Oligoflexia bacterium]|nr:AI-2E family transporter [Oligoflexia bacterium]